MENQYLTNTSQTLEVLPISDNIGTILGRISTNITNITP